MSFFGDFLKIIGGTLYFRVFGKYFSFSFNSFVNKLKKIFFSKKRNAKKEISFTKFINQKKKSKKNKSLFYRLFSVFQKSFFIFGFLFGSLIVILFVWIIFGNIKSGYDYLNDPFFRSEYFISDDNYLVNKIYNKNVNYGKGQINLVLKNGDNLASILIANFFDKSEAESVIKLLKSSVNLKQMKIGQNFKIDYTFEKVAELDHSIKRNNIFLPRRREIKEIRHLENFHFKTSDGSKYNISRSNNSFLFHAERPKLITKRHIITGSITTSLFADVLVSDIKPNTLYNALNEYAFLIDFQRDLHKGDKFIFILDTTRDNDGDVVEEKVLYVNLILNGKDYEMFNFNGRFFNRKGHSIKRALLKTPVDGARISSRFSASRKHPILGYSRAHLGVDLAAPIGTPIQASGDGVVIQKVYGHNGYGNYLVIRHNGEYTTLYAHMSKFANVKVGQSVRQRQVIGYVGMTGLATGPHLHYEVHRHGKHINPSSIKVSSTKQIESKYMDDFNYVVKSIDDILVKHG